MPSGLRRPGRSSRTPRAAVAREPPSTTPAPAARPPTERSVTTTSAPPSPPRAKRRPGDRVFAGSATGAGIFILLVLAGVAAFLVIEAWPALTADPADLPDGKSLAGYIAPLLFGTLLAAVIALLIATPLAVAIALYLTHYAPRRLATTMG